MKFEKEKFEANGMDAMLQALGEAIQKSESRPAILNIERIKQIRQDYLLLAHMAQETDAKVSWGLHNPYVSVGNITLEAEDLIFLDSEKLAEVISRCSNLEIYPLTNGNIRMTLTYLGLVKFLK